MFREAIMISSTTVPTAAIEYVSQVVLVQHSSTANPQTTVSCRHCVFLPIYLSRYKIEPGEENHCPRFWEILDSFFDLATIHSSSVGSKAGVDWAAKTAENQDQNRILFFDTAYSSTAGKQRGSVVVQYILTVHPSDLWWENWALLLSPATILLLYYITFTWVRIGMQL